MKKTIGIVIASLMFCNIGFAEFRLIERDSMKNHELVPALNNVCIDGYKFAIAVWNESVSMVQFYEAGNNQSPIPEKC